MNTQLTSPRFTILSLDGGGIRGLYTASLLARLEDAHGINIRNHFDLITGTSTGGIIALALALGIPPKEIENFYLDHGPRIFKPRRLHGLRWLFGVKYPQQPLTDALRAVFDERTLADCDKRVVIPTYDLGHRSVRLFKTPHHERLRMDWKVPAWQVALATSAAPTFLPASTATDDLRLIDGGMWANNPAIVGIAEAVSMLGVPLDAIRVLSLGTTRSVKERARSLDRGGLFHWAKPATEVMLEAQSQGTNGLAQHLVGHEDVIRLDPEVPPDVLSLDKLDRPRLLSLAAHEARKFAPMFAEQFGAHHAAPYAPLYTAANPPRPMPLKEAQ